MGTMSENLTRDAHADVSHRGIFFNHLFIQTSTQKSEMRIVREVLVIQEKKM